MYSRWSIPLIASFLLLIGGVVAYSVFGWRGWWVESVEDARVSEVRESHSDFFIVDEFDPELGNLESEFNKTVLTSPAADSQQNRGLDPQARQWSVYWYSYSEKIPRLYSAEINNQKWIWLDEIARASSTDQIYAGTNYSKWIAYAVAGEREAARAISFDYAKSSKTFAESMAWAMIANAISPNDYYLYICNAGIGDCDEVVFAQASGIALGIMNRYGFKDAQNY